MKRLLSTLLLCLLTQTTLFAQELHTLTLKTSPQGMVNYYIIPRSSYGIKNGSVHQLPAGDRVEIFTTQIITGWKIKEWRFTEGNGEFTSKYNDRCFITMPNEDATVTAFMEYDPDTPDNPMPNAWYPDEGKLVLDYVNGTSFYTLANTLVPTKEDKELVSTIIVCGTLDWSQDILREMTASRFPSLRHVDISRTDYHDTVWGLQNLPWQKLILPDGVRGFSKEAFKGTNLEELTIYATTPPSLSFEQAKDEQGNDIKKQNSLPENIVIYVPEESLPLYKAAEGWKDLDIYPIVEDAANLNVSIQAPDGNIKPYYGMTLELLNVKSLYKRVMLIGNRQDYTFNTLPKQTSYDIRLLSRTGAVVAEAKNVRIGTEDANATLTGLRRPCSLQLNVSDGTAPVDAQRYLCLWFDGNGNILSRNNSIDGILEDENVQAIITLNDASLKTVYRQRDTLFISQPGHYAGSIVNYQLKPIPTFRLTTLVKRADGSFFSNETAHSNIYHTGSGELVRQLSFGKLTPDGALSSGEQEPLPEGEYDITVSVDGSNLNNAKQHLSLHSDQTLTFSMIEPRGSSVSIKWKHYGVAAEGVDANEANYTEMSAGEAPITLYDVTNGRDLIDFTITPAGKLRLKELLEPGTEVVLTLGNIASKQYAPAVLRAKADADGNLSYEAITRDYGTLNVSFTATECSRVSVRIYDGKGQLIDAGNAVSVNKTFTSLKDGQYTVVLMEGGTMANAMNSMTDVEKFLRRGTDYVSQEVTVTSGQTSSVNLAKVPSLGNDVHLYTDDATTRITPKRTQLTVGVVQTVSTMVSFLPEYKGHVSNLQVVFNLPADNILSFVQGSVIIDNSTASYTANNSQLTVPVFENRLMRFCVVPHTAGNQSLSAKITFLLDGVKCEQPLPAATFTVKDAEINVTEESASDIVVVSGTATASSPVTIFVNNQETATTASNIYGEWKLRVPLVTTYNGAVNSIYAQYTGNDGYKVNTPEKTVLINRQAIRPLKVRMSHFNEWTKSQQVVVFDLSDNTCTPNSYMFYHEAEFTFEVTLNTLDSTDIDNVLLYVYMSNNQKRLLFPKYNPKNGKWIATDVFKADGLPSNVRVYVEDHASRVLSERLFSDRIHFLDSLYNEYVAEDTVMQRLTAIIENSTAGSEEHTEAIRQIMTLSGINPDEMISNAVTLPDTPEALSQWEADMDAAIAKIDAALAGYDQMKDDGYLDANNTPFNQLGTVMGGYTFSTIPANARAYYEARARGEHPALYRAASPNEYEYEMQLENGSFIYYRISDNGYTLTIPAEDLQVTLNYANMDTELLAAVRELNLNLARLSDMQQQQIPFRSMGEELLDKLASIMDKIGEAMSKVSTELSLLKDYMDRTRDGFQIMIDGHVDDLYKSTKEGWEQFWATNSKWVNNDKFKIMQAKGAVAAMKMRDLRKAQQYLQNAAKWLGNLGKVLNVVSLISDGNDLIDACSKLLELAYTIPDPCENDKEKAEQIMFEFNTYGLARVAQKAYAFTNDALSVAAAIAGVASGGITGGVGTIGGLAVSLGLSVVNFVGNKLSDRYWTKWTKEWEKRIDELQCDELPCRMQRLQFDNEKDLSDNGKCGDSCQKSRNAKKGDAPGGCPGPNAPIGGVSAILDPSGYVYEAVGSNRVADALASVYYKETYEDMYGDEHERTVLWDAAEFDQVNPMLTDKNGEYGWDVPAGMWQVRVVKDGFVDTYSEWLPVPPPQLDVNLAMTQPSAPVVERVVATEEGVELTFDKYMKLKHLTTDNIFLTKGGQKLDGTVLLQDAERAPDSLQTYARRVLFQPVQPLKLNDKVRLTVKAGMESYADVAMLQDFTQEFDIEQHVTQLITDSIIGILYNEQNTITVSAQPAAIAAGKKVIVSTLNPDIAAIDDKASEELELTFNQEGKTSLTVYGKGFGTTALRFVLADDKDIEAYTIVGVRDNDNMMTQMPTASRISGTEVTYGSTVKLQCQTPGAVIYYTLDGSCPCDEANRIRYDGPISIINDVVLKAVAIAPGYAESDVATFVYKVWIDPECIYSITTDGQSGPVYTIEGVRIVNPTQKGVYINNGKKVVIR